MHGTQVAVSRQHALAPHPQQVDVVALRDIEYQRPEPDAIRLRHPRGFDKSQIWSEGYWRPGRIGGHDHIDD